MTAAVRARSDSISRSGNGKRETGNARGPAACRRFLVTFDRKHDAFNFPVSEPATIVLDREGRLVYAYHGTAPPDRPAGGPQGLRDKST